MNIKATHDYLWQKFQNDEMVDLAFDIINFRLEELNVDKVQRAIDEELRSCRDQKWTMMAYYQLPEQADYVDAYWQFVGEMECIVEHLAEQKKGED